MAIRQLLPLERRYGGLGGKALVESGKLGFAAAKHGRATVDDCSGWSEGGAETEDDATVPGSKEQKETRRGSVSSSQRCAVVVAVVAGLKWRWMAGGRYRGHECTRRRTHREMRGRRQG